MSDLRVAVPVREVPGIAPGGGFRCPAWCDASRCTVAGPHGYVTHRSPAALLRDDEYDVVTEVVHYEDVGDETATWVSLEIRDKLPGGGPPEFGLQLTIDGARRWHAQIGALLARLPVHVPAGSGGAW